MRSAFDCACDCLSRRDLSEKELVQRLRKKEYKAEEITAALEKLTEYGYVNDARYASLFVKSRAESKGKRRIALELAQKGIEDEVAAHALAGLPEDETPRVVLMLQRRYGGQDLSDPAQKRRVYGFFQRRGFSFDSVERAIRLFTEGSRCEEENCF